MDSVEKYIRGYIRIRLVSSAPERFFSLCVHNQIPIHNLIRTDSCYEMDILARDFFRLNRFRKKTGARIHIVKKNGLPFFLQRARKRKSFFLGMLLGFLILYLCSLRIWDIRISGNHYYTTPVLLDVLSHWDIKSGMEVRDINCQKLMAQIRQEFPGIVWVSARLEGTCLIIEVKENETMIQTADPAINSNSCWDLSSPWNGTVKSIITRSGMPLVKPGDSCKKGDILVSGRLEILDNDNQVQRYQYVKADADIIIETQFPYYDEFSRTVSVKSYTGESYTYPFISLFGKDISCFRTPEGISDICRFEKRAALTPSFYLPVTAGKIVSIPYIRKTYHYNEEETAHLSETHLQNFLQSLVAEKAVILSKSIHTKITSERCRSHGYVTIQIPGSIKTITKVK